MTLYKISFKYSESIYCTNLAKAENREAVERHYNKYSWVSIQEATGSDEAEAKRKGMPIVNITT